MKYIVMECHMSYAVVLDEDGRFLNVANRHYEVGQTVTDVIEIQTPPSENKAKVLHKRIASIVAAAACLMLIFTAVLRFGAAPYGSVYMTINPEVRIDVNKNDTVIDVEGINEDGKTLVEDYSYRKKNLDLVMDELVDLAVEMGYLHEGGQITLTLDAEDGEWVVSRSDSLDTHLHEHLDSKMSVTIEVTNKGGEGQGVTVPLAPETAATQSYGDSDYAETTFSPPDVTEKPKETSPQSPADTAYGDTDYDPNNDGMTDYGDTDYGPNSDGVTDYDDTDYGPNNDAVTDHDDTVSDTDSDGATDYSDTDYGPNSDGATDYTDTVSDTDSDGVTDYTDTDSDSDSDGVTDYTDTDSDSDSDGVTDYSDITEDSQEDYENDDDSDADDSDDD